MTIGYSAAGGCWATTSEAIDAYYSAQQSLVVYNGTAAITWAYQKIGGAWKQYYYGTGTAVTPNAMALPTNVYGNCTLETSPGYPQQLTGSTGTGTGSGTVTGTVSIAPYDVTYDYASASAAFMTGLSMVLMFWLAAKPIGIVLNAIKRW